MIYAAIAIPNILGIVPKTGKIRALKSGNVENSSLSSIFSSSTKKKGVSASDYKFSLQKKITLPSGKSLT